MPKEKSFLDTIQKIAIIALTIAQFVTTTGWMRASDDAKENNKDLMKLMMAFVELAKENDGESTVSFMIEEPLREVEEPINELSGRPSSPLLSLSPNDNDTVEKTGGEEVEDKGFDDEKALRKLEAVVGGDRIQQMIQQKI